MKTTQTPDQNQLAYMLADKLQDTALEFGMTHRNVNINVMIGAANCFLGSWLIHAPNRQKALEGLEMCAGIIRSMIEQTSDSMFGVPNPTTLN